MKIISVIVVIFLTACLSACTGVPDKIEPVQNFVASRYLGKWYEIARLDNSFERGLSKVTAEYSLREDGGIKVINRGYSSEDGRWKEAEGKAYYVQGPHIAHLKVSFFGPFYASYVVFELDKKDYQYSLISGHDKSYLWLLSRTPSIDEITKKSLIAKASAAGFDTGKLVFVNQN
ncbi:lipocalin family protein [Undibacterium terreum]|uniref:Outer membrane lipoprotein Blc n=1 Tax=Undibacterium terreum TaxID=1224302 RepID=A0A916UF34_9BURK|nr:lipocalin family protein [Undibacterium terreum]GGC70034.1 hypothetical protein GCM10011396_16340 [Undibacterium terreum]